MDGGLMGLDLQELKPSPKGRKVVLFAAAGAAGIVAYAWWRNRSAVPAGPAVDAGNVDPATGLPYSPAPTNSVESGGGAVDTGVPTPITDNPSWTQAALTQLANVGYDALFAAQTLGKYLARKPLSSAEQELVQTTLGLVGPPPQGQPYAVIPAVSGSNTTTNPWTGAIHHPGLNRLSRVWNLRELAASTFPAGSNPSADSIEVRLRRIVAANPDLAKAGVTSAPAGFALQLPSSVWAP
jgi:hypothetical protein